CRKSPPNGRTASLDPEDNAYMNQKQTINGVSYPYTSHSHVMNTQMQSQIMIPAEQKEQKYKRDAKKHETWLHLRRHAR
ncbi:hypothetical protein KZP20_08630, partial [Bifidobacterium pseudocatenulatum]|uniref:hypothetical protein n=1 Tax=Bifidobacterium pseudocatenulatum TaxID=28026 RepID=UPI001CFAC635